MKLGFEDYLSDDKMLLKYKCLNKVCNYNMFLQVFKLRGLFDNSFVLNKYITMNYCLNVATRV